MNPTSTRCIIQLLHHAHQVIARVKRLLRYQTGLVRVDKTRETETTSSVHEIKQSNSFQIKKEK